MDSPASSIGSTVAPSSPVDDLVTNQPSSREARAVAATAAHRDHGRAVDETSKASSNIASDRDDALPQSGLASKDTRFWLIIISLLLATFLAALDVTAISTALPTIAGALESREFAWIANAYSVTSCAFIPLAGGLSAIFGRRLMLLIALGFFFVGSTLCGAAQNIDMMLAGRALQGVGAGSILTLTEIVLADLVPLAERGTYQGFFGAIWSLASATGPIIGGALAEVNWRILFYINLPLTAVISVVVALCVKLKTPPGTTKEKLQRIDFLGNGVFIASVTLLIIGLVWGDAPYPWTSAHVLAPLIIGAVGLVAWVVIETRVEFPTVPFAAMNNRTTTIGFITTWLHGISALSIFYYWPAWFQAVKGAGPIKSAVDFFSVAFICAPFAMVAGASIGILQVYKPQNLIAWILMTLGPGVLSLVTANSPARAWVPLPIPYAMGVGLLYAATVFPVLAPLSPTLAGPALAFLVFVRSFGNLLGVTVGSVVLTNELKSRAPPEWLSTVPGGVSGAYAAIPSIKFLPEPLRTSVQVAFAQSIRTLWLVMIAFGGIGLIFACFMRALPLQTETDENFGIKDKKVVDPEKVPITSGTSPEVAGSGSTTPPSAPAVASSSSA